MRGRYFVGSGGFRPRAVCVLAMERRRGRPSWRPRRTLKKSADDVICRAEAILQLIIARRPGGRLSDDVASLCGKRRCFIPIIGGGSSSVSICR